MLQLLLWEHKNGDDAVQAVSLTNFVVELHGSAGMDLPHKMKFLCNAVLQLQRYWSFGGLNLLLSSQGALVVYFLILIILPELRNNSSYADSTLARLVYFWWHRQ